jgi:hypothetical protein
MMSRVRSSSSVALGVSAGIVVPLDESATLTAALTLTIATALQIIYQMRRGVGREAAAGAGDHPAADAVYAAYT